MNKLRGVGNMAYLAFGDNGGVAIHETLHDFGLGDRYFEALLYNYVDALGNKGTVSVQSSQEGFEKDVMGKEAKVNDFSKVGFNQSHIDNLSRNALSTYKANGKNKFIMGKQVDRENSSNVNKAPSIFKIDGTTYSREDGKEIK